MVGWGADPEAELGGVPPSSSRGDPRSWPRGGGAGGANAVAESRKGNPEDEPLEGFTDTEI